MKLVRRSFQFLTGRWMRRLVWLPLGLFAVLCTGATMQALGVKLSLLPKASNARNTIGPWISYLDQPQHFQPTRPTAPNPSFAMKPIPIGGSFEPPLQVQSLQSQPFPSTAPAHSNLQFAPPKIPNVNGVGSGAQAPQSFGQTYNTNQQPAQLNNTSKPVDIPANQFGTSPFNVPATPDFSGSLTQPQIPAVSPLNALSQSILTLQGDDEAALRNRLNELLTMTIQHFDEKQSQEREQLKSAKESLAMWEEAITQRDSLKKPLIESHIAQLLQSPDLLNWSFTGSELLKVNSKEANYIEMVRKLWPTETAKDLLPKDSAPETDPAADLPPTFPLHETVPALPGLISN